MTTFLSNRDIYTSVVCGIVPQALPHGCANA